MFRTSSVFPLASVFLLASPVLALLAGSVVVGCGATRSPHPSRTGVARFTIQWPSASSRLIPTGANSIKIVLSGPTNITKVVGRPSSGSSTVTIPDLLPGSYTVTASAHPNNDGTGVAQALGTVNVTILERQTSAVSLTMDSTISRVEILRDGASIAGNTFSLAYNTSAALSAAAYDSAGQLVLVAPEHWEWSRDSAAGFTLTPNNASATLSVQTTPGSTILTLKERESGVLSSAVLVKTQPTITLIWLGHLPTTGTKSSQAVGLSEDGTVVVGINQYGASLAIEGFRWTKAAGMTSYGVTTDRPTCLVFGVSADGSRVAGESRTSTSAINAFRGQFGSPLELLGSFPTGTGVTTARAISRDGSVVVGWGTTARAAQEAFRWTQATGLQSIGFLNTAGTLLSVALATSRDGSVITGYSASPNGAQETFRWTQATGMVALGDLPGGAFNGRGQALSADGSIVAGYSDSVNGREAFRWTQATGMVALGDLAGGTVSSSATAISPDGALLGGFSNTAKGNEAFVWNESLGMRSLNTILLGYDKLPTGSLLQTLTGISADKRTLAGTGLHDGVQEAYWLYKDDGWDIP